MSTLDNLRKEAKRWLKALRDGDTEARARLDRAFPKAPAQPGLRDIQHALARERGVVNWKALTETAGRILHPEFAIDSQVNRIRPRRPLAAADWDKIIEAMREQRISGLDAHGQMTDEVLARVVRLHHVTHLDLGGSQHVSDAGLRLLASLPNLQSLNLSGCAITDDGLQVLRQLPELLRFRLYHQDGISDGGTANLASCPHLEDVDLMNTPTGDRTLHALTGKPRLASFKAGNDVTDAGLALLREFPVFQSWQGGEVVMSLMSPNARPNFLWLSARAPFTNEGLSQLGALDGLFALSLFGSPGNITSAGLRHLAGLPYLGWLGCTGRLCDDEAMRHIGGMPHLRMLMAQGAVATDDGFKALSRSAIIEYIWGRECPNLTGRGFAALSKMPVLRGLAVSCRNVDDVALSTLPRFPALRELMPMDVSDEGFRHVGRCERLEALWCMYCRETTDAATEHIAGLTALHTYYAGKTRITDRSLEILSRMASLETLRFWQCAGISDAGVALLTRLPRLREAHFEGGMPQVTLEGTAILPPRVRVEYSA